MNRLAFREVHRTSMHCMCDYISHP